MIQEPTRRQILVGGLATAATGLLAANSVAKSISGSAPKPQGGMDPIVSVPPTTNVSSAAKLFITICPPPNYTPGVQYTVKIVQMVFSVDAQQRMSSAYLDENLDGIESGEFETSVTFPANSGPTVISISLLSMAVPMNRNYTVIAFNSANSGAAMFQLTP